MNVQLCFILDKKKTLCTISPCRSGLKQGFIILGNRLHVLFLLNTALTVLWLSHILLPVLFFPIIIVSKLFFRIFSISATKIYIRCAKDTESSCKQPKILLKCNSLHIFWWIAAVEIQNDYAATHWSWSSSVHICCSRQIKKTWNCDMFYSNNLFTAIE